MHKLKAISATKSRTALPMVLRVNGSPTCDRSEWLTEAERFGRQRFGNPFNALVPQIERIEELASLSQGFLLDGRIPPRMDCVAGPVGDEEHDSWWQ